MKEDKGIQEKFRIIDREFATIAEKLDGIRCSLKEVEDLKTEIKALKLFIGREHKGFRHEFPGIISKVTNKK